MMSHQALIETETLPEARQNAVGFCEAMPGAYNYDIAVQRSMSLTLHWGASSYLHSFLSRQLVCKASRLWSIRFP